MELYEAIRGRRSVRQFRDEPVDPQKIDRILDAALWAPSAHNAQAWRFTLVGQLAKEAIACAMIEAGEDLERRGESAPGLKATARLVAQAPVLIAASYAQEKVIPLQESYTLGEVFRLSAQVQSVAAAIENLLLAAHAEGLGGVWIGYTNLVAQELRRILCDDGFPVATVALGDPLRMPPAPERKPKSERIVVRG